MRSGLKHERGWQAYEGSEHERAPLPTSCPASAPGKTPAHATRTRPPRRSHNQAATATGDKAGRRLRSLTDCSCAKRKKKQRPNMRCTIGGEDKGYENQSIGERCVRVMNAWETGALTWAPHGEAIGIRATLKQNRRSQFVWQRKTEQRSRGAGQWAMQRGRERMSDGASSCPRARKTTAHVTPPRPHTLYHRTIHTPRSQAEKRTSLMECGHCDRWRPRRSDTDGPGAPRRRGACVGPSSTH